MKASRIINMDLSTYWPTRNADCNSSGNGVARLPSGGKNKGYICLESNEIPDEDEEVLVGRQRMAISMIATIFQEMGVIVLKPSAFPQNNMSSKMNIIDIDGARDSDVRGENDCDVQFLDTKASPRRKVSIFPPHLMNELVEKAKLIEAEVCNRLDE
eukprot:10326125-Ditylum_brightwellii.AAC.1